MKSTLTLILLILSGTTIAQDSLYNSFVPSGMNALVVLHPTGEMINELPVMVELSDTTHLYQRVVEVVDSSFIKDVIDLYFLAAAYLRNNNVLSNIESTYLVLSENDGGFAKIGFYLKQPGGIINKSETPYIDIVKNRFLSNPDRLMSITQLYPHEMGHLLFRLLNPNNKYNESKSVDMHYFSVITDFTTAFNEGFAEHIENVSRRYEKNETIKKGIFSDIETTKIKSANAIDGFEKDFIYPFRFGFYKMTMPLWYQKFETLRACNKWNNKIFKCLNRITKH